MSISMSMAMAAIMVFYAVALIVVAKKAASKTKSVGDYFSYGEEHNIKHLMGTFEVSNVSLMTSFLALFIYTYLFGWQTLWLAFGFCLGIVIYANILLPKQAEYLFDDKRYPLLFGRLTGSRGVQVIVGLFVLFNLWLFLFAEVQGFILFTRATFVDSQWVVLLLPVIIIGGTLAYICVGGFQAVVLTDKVQMWLIRAGSASLGLLLLIVSKEKQVDIDWEKLDISVLFSSLRLFC